MNTELFKVKEGNDADLSGRATTPPFDKEDNVLKKALKRCTKEIDSLQYRLYAENRQSLLIVLQGMDASGKDSTIRRLMSGVNPQGVFVASFKHPSTNELEYNYLWRHYSKLPQKGTIGIFNRSYYENVLISRVHPELVLAERMPGIHDLGSINAEFWQERYNQIRQFERILVGTGTHIVKFFLYMSKDEQKRRFLSRIERPEKHWKFSASDIRERKYWDDYIMAYSQAIKHTSSEIAPWYVIPADNKPFARFAIGEVVLQTLQGMDPGFPAVNGEDRDLIISARKELQEE